MNMNIGGFTPFTLSDYPEKISCIIFTQGCNFACIYCHNRSLIHYKETKGANKVIAFLEKRVGKLNGVVISGGEPTIQKDLVKFLVKIKELGFQIKLDTNGSKPAVIKDLLNMNLIDFIAMDLKAPFEKYEKICRKKVNINNIQESIDIIKTSKIPHLFRTTFFKNYLTETDLEEIKKIVPDGSNYIVQKYK